MQIEDFKVGLEAEGILSFPPIFEETDTTVKIYQVKILVMEVTKVFINRAYLNPVTYVAEKINQRMEAR